jgi:hypothetical protein
MATAASSPKFVPGVWHHVLEEDFAESSNTCAERFEQIAFGKFLRTFFVYFNLPVNLCAVDANMMWQGLSKPDRIAWLFA